MAEWIRNIIETLGYPGIVFLLFLENVFPPIPSELVIPLAGFTASDGSLTLVGVVIAGTIGSVLGALPLYYLGRAVPRTRLKRWADKHGRWLLLDGNDIDRAQDWLENHGRSAVFLCRLVPGVRSLISIPAGSSNMHLPTFLFYTALGTALWTALLAYLGLLLGDNYEQIASVLGSVGNIVWIVIGVAVVIWVMRRVRRRS